MNKRHPRRRAIAVTVKLPADMLKSLDIQRRRIQRIYDQKYPGRLCTRSDYIRDSIRLCMLHDNGDPI